MKMQREILNDSLITKERRLLSDRSNVKALPLSLTYFTGSQFTGNDILPQNLPQHGLINYSSPAQDSRSISYLQSYTPTYVPHVASTSFDNHFTSSTPSATSTATSNNNYSQPIVDITTPIYSSYHAPQIASTSFQSYLPPFSPSTVSSSAVTTPFQSPNSIRLLPNRSSVLPSTSQASCFSIQKEPVNIHSQLSPMNEQTSVPNPITPYASSQSQSTDHPPWTKSLYSDHNSEAPINDSSSSSYEITDLSGPNYRACIMNNLDQHNKQNENNNNVKDASSLNSKQITANKSSMFPSTS